MSAQIHQIDPTREIHYAISEDGEWRLRDLAEAMDAVGGLLDCFDPEQGDLSEAGLGSLCRVWSRGVLDAIGDRVSVIPGKGKAK